MYRDRKGNLMEKRVKRDILLAIVAIPLILVISELLERPKTGKTEPQVYQVDTGHVAPSVSDTLTFAHPHARGEVDVHPYGTRLLGRLPSWGAPVKTGALPLQSPTSNVLPSYGSAKGR